jgi:PleD family two-component response regulator
VRDKKGPGRDAFRLDAGPEQIYTTKIAGKILVVDDDPRIRRVLRIMLAGQGYEIDDAKSGKVALEKLRQHRFDLVLGSASIDFDTR